MDDIKRFSEILNSSDEKYSETEIEEMIELCRSFAQLTVETFLNEEVETESANQIK